MTSQSLFDRLVAENPKRDGEQPSDWMERLRLLAEEEGWRDENVTAIFGPPLKPVPDDVRLPYREPGEDE